MFVATTPKHTFTFPVSPEEFKRILITYTQNGKTVLEKTEQDLTFEEIIDGNRIIYAAWLALTQEETKKFDPALEKFTVQVRALSNHGEAIAGGKHVFSVESVLNDGVLS